MTDKLPRPAGGDGDGPDETPMERLLREAMNARATQITAHDLRPAEPPSRRLRRLKPVYLTAVPLFGLAAAMAFGVLGFHGDPVADRDRTPPPAATATEGPSPAVSPTAEPVPTPTESTASPGPATTTITPAGDDADGPGTGPTPQGGPSSSSGAPSQGPATPYTFRGVKLKIPAGWRVAPDADSYGLCILSPGAPQNATSRDCQPYGAQVHVSDVDAEYWPSLSFMDSAGGWGTQPYCAAWGNPHVPDATELLKGVGPVKTTATVGGLLARKSQWQVTCNAKDSFTAQMWALPKEQVYVSAIGLKADYQAGLLSLVNSLDVSGHPAPFSGDVTVSATGLAPGQAVPNDGSPVEFSVTFKNTGRTAYPGGKVLFYPGMYTSDERFPRGTVERLDGADWTPVDFGSPSDLEKVPVLPLAAGQSVTVKYRLKLTAGEKPGTFPLTVRYGLPVPSTPGTAVPGEVVVPLKVTAK
ncbi:hypothetical protein OH807_22065 [Kitasatospora sp. NBC_01560]|uniref:hypothetical protein n=1 Tax=Kitasatospora sp. NBC_01560 TaxID=2975965 RepID=UPI003868F469